MSRLTVLIIAGITTAFVVGAGIFAGYRMMGASSEPTYHGSYFEPTGEPEEFTLVSAGQDEVRLSDYRGKVVAIYFGYTNCPDICPATLAKLDYAAEQLGDDADDLQVMMVTVDPERDSPQRLEEFVAQFNPSFLGLGGSADQIERVTNDIGIHMTKQPGSDATGYLVEHTTQVVVLDREGRVRLLLPFDLTGDEIASDLEKLL